MMNLLEHYERIIRENNFGSSAEDQLRRIQLHRDIMRKDKITFWLTTLTTFILVVVVILLSGQFSS